MKKIEVYIRNEEIFVPISLPENYFSILGKWNIIPWNSIKSFGYKLKIIPEKDQEAIEIARKISEKFEAELKVYDVCKLKGKILAYFKNIKRIPTIVIGEEKIEDLDKEKLTFYLK